MSTLIMLLYLLPVEKIIQPTQGVFITPLTNLNYRQSKENL